MNWCPRTLQTKGEENKPDLRRKGTGAKDSAPDLSSHFRDAGIARGRILDLEVKRPRPANHRRRGAGLSVSSG